MTKKELFFKTGGTIYVAACFAYAGYEWYSYTGIYRWAAEWQMSTFGSYSPKLAFVASLLVLILPVGVPAKLLGWDMKTRGAPFSLRDLLAALSPRVLLAAGLMLLAVAAGAGWWWDEVNANVTFEVFDLSNGPMPRSTHVTMTGVAHPEYLVEFGDKSDNSARRDHYIPVTAESWRRSDPLVYFMKAEGWRWESEFSRQTLPFTITAQRGVLIKNDLPGPVAEIYRKRNLALAPLPVVLNLRPDADADPYFIAAFTTGVVGFGCLLTAAKRAMWRRGD
jgi:hypothetical protein